MSKILITGATGQLGGMVVKHLLKVNTSHQINVLVRDENKAIEFKEAGIGIRVGSYQDIKSLAQALQGIDKLLLISSNDFNDRFGQHKNVIDIALEAGVKHIIYTGVSMKNIKESPLKPLLEDHFKTEEYILESGIDYTFLRNNLYLEVIPMFIGEKVLETGIFFPAGDGRVAFASREDLAEVAATILNGEGHENKSYPLSASSSYSFQDIASELADIAGKKMNYISPEPAEFEAMLKQFGLPAGIIQMSVLFAAGIKNNDFDLPDDTLKTFLGRPEKTLKSFLRETYRQS